VHNGLSTKADRLLTKLQATTLGFTNCYRRFIQGFSHLACPLFDLMWKDTEWRWGAEEQSAFDALKEQIYNGSDSCSARQLVTFSDQSSDFATGAVLSWQSPEDNKWHPVVFLSKSLSPVEWNYKIHNKEMLAIMRALEEWRHFVEGAEHHCEIWTDHKNLQYFMTAKKLNQRQARWSLLLAQFDFIMLHHPGKSMGKTDTLSHQSNHGTGSEDNNNMVLLTPNFFTVQALGGLEVAGEEWGILKDIWKGTQDREKEEPVARAARELQGSSARSVKSAEWSLNDGLLYFWGKIYVPDTSNLCHWIVTLSHDSRLAGHSGRWKTLELVSRNYWWPQMSRYVGRYISTCDMCLWTKSFRRPPTGELHPLPILSAPWDTISMDFIIECLPSWGAFF